MSKPSPRQSTSCVRNIRIGERRSEHEDDTARYLRHTNRPKPYQAYKDSGIEWLGEIPAHWEFKRLKYLAVLRVSKLAAKPEGTIYIGLENIESWTGRPLCQVSSENVESVVSEFRAGDVLFGKLRPYLAKVARPQFNGVSSSELLVLQPAEHSQDYLFYLLLNESYIKWINMQTYGTKMPRVGPDQVSNSFFPLPPSVEQRAIAGFLDQETAKIDALVAKKERLVELLKEKRIALITQAVTKGLDRDVPMKDSGIEWLGEIPAHWEVKRLKFAAKLGPTPSELTSVDRSMEVSFVPMGAVGEYGGLKLSRAKRVADADTGYTYFCEEDVVIAKITPCFENGKGAIATGLLNGIAFGTTELHVLRAGVALETKFLFYLSMGDAFRRLGEAEMYGAGGQKRVPESFIRNLRHPLPPLNEQRAIADFLDWETARIDALVAKVREAIERLKELRAALISAAVTGKIDVREAVT